MSLCFVRTWDFRRKGRGEMGLYVRLVVDEIGQELIDLLESLASIKGTDVECLLIRRGYGGKRCIYSFHFVVCFEYGLLLKQFCVAPYMRLRSLRNVPGCLCIPKSCQMLAVLYTPPPFLVESTWNPRIPCSFRGMDIESSVYV